jgi:hypothetical protein
MPMNNRILRPLARPLLLDAVPGAAAAYSLRQLSNAYTGPVVTVRRSSDNAEADFKASEIDDGTLAAFCGAGDGLVKTWFDQSGNGRDASQGTAANQPKLVSSGVVVTEEGKPAIEFDGTTDYMVTTSTEGYFAFLHNGTRSAVFCIFRFGNVANPGGYRAIISTVNSTGEVGLQLAINDNAPANNQIYMWVMRGVGGTAAVQAISANDAVADQSQSLLSVLLDASNAAASDRVLYHVNGAVVSHGNTRTNAPSSADARYPLCIGAVTPTGGSYFQGALQELVIYPSDLTEQRELAEGLIAWGYSV